LGALILRILITGASGFIGKNLVSQLKNKGYEELFLCDVNTPKEQLDEFLQQCNFIFHLAGVNRTHDILDFQKWNSDFTEQITTKLQDVQNACPIVVCSSIQADNETPYGKSKKYMEDKILSYSKNTEADIYIYRLPNVFGKWCKPNYNSVVATFCNNIATGLPICIDNAEAILNLVYIDDVITEFIKNLNRRPITNIDGHCTIPIVHTISLGSLAKKLYSFQDIRKTLIIPTFKDCFDRKLYATYISYLEKNDFSYKLESKVDERGFFCECIKSNYFGQLSVSITKAGISRGNHWHHTKIEKFMAIHGKGVVKFRKIDEHDVFEYFISGETPEIVDIPPGYTHSIENIGDDDFIMLIWSDELFNPLKPDTWFEEVCV
jgi:UDP-2-acetamido-2,6-beta-L-arabino-hexul-4-ose reductase